MGSNIDSDHTEVAVDNEAIPGPIACYQPNIPPHDDSIQILTEGDTSFRIQNMSVLTPVPTTPVKGESECDDPPLISHAVPHEMLRVQMSYINTEKSIASPSELIQEELILKRSRFEVPTAKSGGNIAVPIARVDRGHVDPRNILGIILNYDENYLYNICGKGSILKGTFSHNQFALRFIELYVMIKGSCC